MSLIQFVSAATMWCFNQSILYQVFPYFNALQFSTFFNPLQLSVEIHVEISHLKRNTSLKWVKM